MEMSYKDEGGEWHCNIKGHFTFTDTFKFKTLLDDIEQKQPQKLVLDFQEAEYIDSAALGMLLVLKEVAEKTNTDITMVHVHSQILKVFTLSRFEEVFDIQA